MRKGSQYATADLDHIISDQTLVSIDQRGHLTGASYEWLNPNTVRVTWNDLGEDDSVETFRRMES